MQKPYLPLIILLPWLLFWRWLFQGQVLFWGTLLFQFWPWHRLVKESLLAGQWPLWNPLLGNGTPLLANLQTAVFYPPNLLYLLMPVAHGLTFSVVLHLMLAGLFMYLYTRQIGLIPFAATVSALAYMFSGYIVGRTQFVPMVNAAAWLPLLLLLAEGLSQSGRLKPSGNEMAALGGLALALAMQLLAGHAQTSFYSVCLVGAYALFRGWQTGRTPALIGAIWRLGLAGGLAALLAAVQILPTAEFIAHSSRHSGAERTFALTYSFWPWRLITLFAPEFFGHPASGTYWGYATYWEDHAYMGLFPLVMALAAIWLYLKRRWRSGEPVTLSLRLTPFFAGFALLSLVLAMGRNTPVYLWLFDTIPGFAYFQAPARLLIWYTAAVAVLAGIGTQHFRLTFAGRFGWRLLLAACLGITVLGLIGRPFLASSRSQTFGVALITLGIWLGLTAVLILTTPHKTTAIQPAPLPDRYTAFWRGAVLAGISLNLFWAAWDLLPMLPPAIFTQQTESAALLRQQPGDYRYLVRERFDYRIKFDQYFRFDRFGPPDPVYWHNFRETLAPNMGVYAGLPAANNDDPLVVDRWRRLLNLVEKTDSDRLAGLMHVGYLLDRPGPTGRPVLYRADHFAIQRVADPLPRAYFVAGAYGAASSAEAIARLTAPDFDSRAELVIMGGAGGSSTGEGAFAPAAIETAEPQRVRLTVEAPAAGFVVLTDTFYPGWQATVDGRPVPIRAANLAFRAISVPAGPHTITFVYRPLSFRLGLIISAATLGAVVVASLLFLIRSTPRPKEEIS